MQDPISPLEKHQSFRFSCSPQAVCFNACCRDLNQRVYTALYDLDAFYAAQAAAPAVGPADPPGADDTEPLLQAMDWVCTNVFGVPQTETLR